MSGSVAHRRDENFEWSVCGVVSREYSDSPTCLNCIAGLWVDEMSKFVRALIANSVKDLQWQEDQKALQYISTYTSNSLGIVATPNTLTSSTLVLSKSDDE